MATIQPLVSEFTITGKLEDYISKSNNCIKSLQLVTEKGDYWIKLAKELRSSLKQKLQPGCLLKVTGMRKYEIHKGKVKYKAYGIEVLKKPFSEQVISDTQDVRIGAKPKAKVLFCQKSTCWKKGGKAACTLLKAELESRGIANQVEIKTVGCLNQCKKAPNIVMMPDKARYSRVNPKQITQLIDKHLLSPI
ncbi:MAG: (2Fe-2S) ferredoxin domain-containing protein [Xenococcaceae cyanobacterium MO_188.B19]|nr:(2Fe-2S) ferredoxin domain-containing protein [Xenococcaceae cyanobacterium MO_188.B19]